MKVILFLFVTTLVYQTHGFEGQTSEEESGQPANQKRQQEWPWWVQGWPKPGPEPEPYPKPPTQTPPPPSPPTPPPGSRCESIDRN